MAHPTDNCNVRISPDLHAAVKKIAEKEDRTVKSVVERAIKKLLESKARGRTG